MQSVADRNAERAPAVIRSAGMAVHNTASRRPNIFAAFAGAVPGTMKVVAPRAGDRASSRAHPQRQPHCACCKPGTNTRAGLQVHHIFPFHYCIALGRPDLELDDRNLITLCEDEAGKPGQNHHLLVGHLDDFQSSNLAVVEDATKTFYGMDATAIRADATWLRKKASRLPLLEQMTAADKEAFKAAMNRRFPATERHATIVDRA